jgi:hypothetical protein
MQARRVMTATGASVIAGTALALVPAAPATAATTFDVAEGSLLAKGAGVALPVTYTCPEGAISFVQGSLNQRSGRSIVSSIAGSGQVACTGEAQTETLVVSAGQPFRRGEALYTVIVTVCDFVTCVDELEQGVLRIT